MSEHLEESTAAKKKSKLPLIIIAVVLLLGGAVGGYFFLFSGTPKDGEEEEVEEEKHQEYSNLLLEPFYVNLAEQSSFLKIVISLEFNKTRLEEILHELEAGHHGGDKHEGEDHEDEEDVDSEDHDDSEEHHGGGGSGGGAAEEGPPPALTLKMASLRDAIIFILSSKKASELLTIEGKELLKEEIIESSNEVLDLGDEIFTKVNFVEFLIQ